MAVCRGSIAGAFGSVGHVMLWLIGQRMEDQTQMFWWTSSATDNNWFRKTL